MNDIRNTMPTLPSGRRTPIALIVTASVFVTTSASAQTVLSPTDAVVKALDRDPSLKSAANDLERARLAVEREDSRFLPEYEVEAGVEGGNSLSLDGEGEVSSVSRNALTGGLSVSQTFSTWTTLRGSLGVSRSIRDSALFGDRGATYGATARIEVSQPWLKGAGDKVLDANLYKAQFENEAAKLAHDREASALIRDVLNAYWELWYAQRVETIRLEALAIAKEQLDQGQARADAGAIAETDLLPLLTEVASLEESVSAARASVRSRAINLSRLVDGTGTSDLRVETSAPKAEMAPSLSTTVRRAEESSLDLQRLLASLESRKIDVVVAEDNEQIQLDTVGWLEISGLGTDPGGVATTFGSFDGVTGFVGIRVSGPFDGTYDKAESSRARMAVTGAEFDIQAERERLRASVLELVNDLEAANERYELAQRTLKLAEDSTKIEQARFNAGASTALDVVNVLQREREAELRVARAVVDIRVGHVAIDDLTGELLSLPAIER